MEAEIYLYDTLPGGAGFSQRVGSLGLSVFEDALAILEDCPEDCDRSCYRCLRNYRNKLEHDLLDRQVGASLLKYLIRGSYPSLGEYRLAASTNLLYEDIRRHGFENVDVERNHPIEISGIGEVLAPIYIRKSNGVESIIGLHGPLTPDDPPDSKLREVKEYCPSIPVLLHDEIAVRRNLPTVTSRLIDHLDLLT